MFDDELPHDLAQWFREKLRLIPGYVDTMWSDNDHLDIFTDFCMSYDSKKVHCFLVKQKDEVTLKATFNTNDLKTGFGEMLYFLREPGLLTSQTVGQMVKVGRTRLQHGQQILVKVMSDLQILVKRKGASARAGNSRGGMLQRASTPVDGPRQPRGSLMPCYRQTDCTDPPSSRYAYSDALGSKRYPSEIHPFF
eukprot:CAMPEP_0118949578 /NCGR_PEP_ID=MMETSP1169-20130426/49903_1 /TAXON_ID=36882 /ORGANISM="Pyramimonas obovata, Strain CCMP722" /LENGTH=193 /DNA_ID=CAMNT_0006896253 /DNA_START=6 /DNA_END=584 /DNA_ORIENTATION=+